MLYSKFHVTFSVFHIDTKVLLLKEGVPTVGTPERGIPRVYMKVLLLLTALILHTEKCMATSRYSSKLLIFNKTK